MTVAAPDKPKRRPAPPQWARDQAEAHRLSDAGRGVAWDSDAGCHCGACRLVREGRPRKRGTRDQGPGTQGPAELDPHERKIAVRCNMVGGIKIIPPEVRVVVSGCSAACATCEKFTRSGGGCPGVRPRDPAATPVCHSAY